MNRFLLLCFLIPALFSGCSPQRADNAARDLSEATPIYLETWPENEYTAQIPKLEYGKLDYVYDLSGSGKYFLFFRDISIEQSEAYLEQLQVSGYENLAFEKNSASAGTMFQKGNITLSISYTNGIFAIGILKT